VIAENVADTASFYEALGFERHFQFPTQGEPGYVGLRRGQFGVAVVAAQWPQQQYGRALGAGVRFELFVYVDDVDATVESLCRNRTVEVLREPADMPWGERVGYVADPEGNPVALAAPSGT
jgi:lactoylglutathione lyase